jgi:fatty acyl-CoA reductase
VSGELTAPGLNLDVQDAEELKKNVQVILHSAADVRFERPLSEAFAINVEGTRNLLELAKSSPNMTVFLHVSTAFSHCNRTYIEDRIFAEETHLADATEMTAGAFKDMEAKPDFDRRAYLRNWPNSYTYTKVRWKSVELSFCNDFT